MNSQTQTLNIFTSEQSKHVLDFQNPIIDIFSYTERLANNSSQILYRVFQKLEIPRNAWSKFFTDITIPLYAGGNIGGYFHTEKKFIALNPLLLMEGDELKIAEVIQHEYLHSEGIADEGITQHLTEEIMIEKYGRVGFESGYTDLVDNIKHFFKNDPKEIIDLITKDEDGSLDYIVEQIVLEPLFDEINFNGKFSELSFWNIRKELQLKWDFLLENFPRLFNKVDERNVDPFTNAIMNIKEYNFSSLLKKAAQRIFEDEILLHKILSKVKQYFGVHIYDENSLRGGLFDLGLGYLADHANSLGINLFELINFEQ